MMQAFSSQRYNRLSDQYDRSHARWLRHEGGEAQCAFEGAAAALMRPDLSMLDVACGTGATIRRLIASAGAPSDLMLLDASQRMLDRCADLPGGRVKGLMQRLPFRADRFDLVTCAWGIETLDHPDPALAELVRVTRPGGHICLVFCAERPVRTICTSSRSSFAALAQARIGSTQPSRVSAVSAPIAPPVVSPMWQTTMSAPAFLASSALSSLAKTATRMERPVPFGRVITPRTIWSE